MNRYSLIALGSLLEVPGYFCSLYRHVGVYLGNGWVMHSQFGRGIEIVTLESFRGQRELLIREHGVTDYMSFQTRVQQAMANPARYDLMFNNCEHLATWLRTGRSESVQVRNFILLSALAAVSILAISTASERS